MLLTKKAILQKTMQVGGSTLLSRFFGIIRELLMVRYLGAGATSDAFLTAFKIPNSLRKIFAEGALSASFIPTIVHAMRFEGKRAVAALMTLGLIFFETILFILCLVAIWQAPFIIWFIAPGFTQLQIATAIPYLRIVMFYILFLSSSALLAGALQASGKFFVPAFSQVISNIIFIIALCFCIFFKLPATVLCWFILLMGLVQFIIHLIAYHKEHFSFEKANAHDRALFWQVMIKFLLSLPSVSMMEIALFIDTSFASYLPAGSVSLIYYANRFVGIPLGIFPLAFSTILLPHFSRVGAYAPKRLGFYLMESMKFIFWLTIPVMLLMAFFSEKIFQTLFLSSKFSLDQVYEAARILIVAVSGLFFFSLNKILLNIFYALHLAWIPTLISLTGVLINILFNFLLIHQLKAVGLTLATVIAGGLQTALYLLVLHHYLKMPLYLGAFLQSALRSLVQLSIGFTIFVGVYQLCAWLIASTCAAPFFLAKIGFWFWVGPLMGLFMAALWYWRPSFGITLYFLD